MLSRRVQYPYPQRPAMDAPRAAYPQSAPPRSAPMVRTPNEPDDDEDDDQRVQTRPAAPAPSVNRPLPSLGPSRGPRVTGSATPVEIKPAATLACPIVSALDQWIAASVQPAAHKWFGQPVAEIKQISAYSCRGMNGQVGARISEHAFGNALDIAAFVLADGKRVTIKGGWQGSAEEQGFLRDVQAAACDQFTTVLAPGSNRYHYDHIHVDLMRRPSGRRICQPGAVDGELVAARARKGGPADGGPSVRAAADAALRPAVRFAQRSVRLARRPARRCHQLDTEPTQAGGRRQCGRPGLGRGPEPAPADRLEHGPAQASLKAHSA